VQLAATSALLDASAEAVQRAWLRQEALTEAERGACAVAVATGKVRATSARYRFDRFWRNARTLTLHDPVDYKVRDVGDWALNGQLPTPSFYS